jgi:hypothetical protein
MENKRLDVLLANLATERKDQEKKRDEAIGKIAEIDEIVASLRGITPVEPGRPLTGLEKILYGQEGDIAAMTGGGNDA